MNHFTVRKVSELTVKDRVLLFTLIILAVISLLRYIIWWFNPIHIPLNYGLVPSFFNIIIFITLSFVVFHSVSQRILSWLTIISAARPEPVEPEANKKVAFLTCFVPGKEPLSMLEKTLRAMKNVRYPHDTWVLDEGDDSEVKSLCKSLGVFHFSRKGIQKYNQESGKFRTKTKAGNHNAWLVNFEKNYDYIAQIDMDHIPHADFLEKTLGYFKDPKVGVVGIPQVYKNLDNWIAKGSAEQGHFFHGPIQKGYYGADMPFLIGTGHIYRRTAMEDIGGYAPTIVEDHLTGMRFYAKGWKGIYVPEILAEGEGPLNWVDYFNQQMRWSFGLFEIFFKFTPKIIFKLNFRQALNYFLAQLYYFNGVMVILGVALTVIYLIWGINSASMNLWDWLNYSIPPAIFANLIQIYAHKFNIEPKKEPVFGILGNFLNLGANVIYGLAFLKFITGAKLKYMVTRKGESGSNQIVPLTTFLPHMAIVIVLTLALRQSLVHNHNAIQQVFWAVFNIVTFTVAFLSVFYEDFKIIYKGKSGNSKIFRYAVNITIVLFFVTSGLYSYSNRGVIAKTYLNNNDFYSTSAFGQETVELKLKPSDIGTYLGLSLYEQNNHNKLKNLENSLNKNFAIVGFYQSWNDDNNRFNKGWAYEISDRGAIPMITWQPWKPVLGYKRTKDSIDQKDFRLTEIVNGHYDNYIKQFATDVKNYRRPVLIRFAQEMNGNWYPWGREFNQPADYVEAWRHIHKIFSNAGALNVTWIWSPNELLNDPYSPDSDKFELFYPGDDYVDWVGFSSFNWAGLYKQNIYRDPDALYSKTIFELAKYNKPMMISETASAELASNPQRKADWIKKLAVYLKNNSLIKAVVWFNINDGNAKWSIDSSSQSAEAFKETFSDPYFIEKPIW